MLHRLEFAALLALAGSATAQFADVAVSFSPNPAPPATNVVVTITNSTASTIKLPSPCTWFEIHAGTQTGPLVPVNAFCPAVIVPVAPRASTSFTWDQIDAVTGNPVPPGRYWFQTRFWDSGFTTLTENWFCLDVQPATEPALTVAGTVRVSMSNSYSITAPTLPNQIYVVLFSFTTDHPVYVPGFLDICLSPPWFAVRDGTLDPTGADGFTFGLVNDPTLAFKGFHFQTLILDAATSSFFTTNDLSLTIAP